MRMLIRKLFPVCVAAVLVGCSNGPVEYAADNSGGYLHQISTDPSEIFRNKVNHEADLEARGVEPPVGNARKTVRSETPAAAATARMLVPS